MAFGAHARDVAFEEAEAHRRLPGHRFRHACRAQDSTPNNTSAMIIRRHTGQFKATDVLELAVVVAESGAKGLEMVPCNCGV